MTDPPQAKPPVAALRRKVTLAALAGFLALLTCEILLQLIEQPTASIRFQQDVGVLDQHGMTQLAALVENDTELFWRLSPGTTLPLADSPFYGTIANQQGLREDHEIPAEKPANRLRILFLGDSCTFGFGLKHNEGYVDIAEQRLNQNLAGRSVECINAGVPGYTLFQGWRFWQTAGHLLKPDFVVVCFGANDMDSWDDKTDREHHAHLQQLQPPGLLRNSAISRRLWATYHRFGPEQVIPKPRVTVEDFQYLLGKLHASITAKQAKMVIISWPLLFQVEESREFRTPWQQEMVSFAQQHQVLLLDLVPEFHQLADQHGARALYFDKGHASALGNQEIGKRVADLLEKNIGNPVR